MSNTILSSNANSSLINTLLGSESVKNPNIYSTEEITPPYAATWQRCDPTTGDALAGRTQVFNVMKYGYLQQALLCWEKEFTVAVAPNETKKLSSANDVIRCIDNIELMASGRVVSTLTADDLYAQFSDLSEADSIPVRASALNARTVSVPSAANGGVAITKATVKYCLPIVFPQFESVDTQLNCQFLEGISFRVKWGKIDNFDGDPTAAAIPANSMYMRFRYKAFPEEQVSEVLSANFDQPELAQLTSRWYSEAPFSFTTGAAETTKDVTVELKNTDCVQDLFAMGYVAAPGEAYVPQRITNIKLEASGQTIFEMSEEELLYARLGEHGWSCSQSTSASGTAANVAKIQNGLYTWYKLSNTMSLRELNAPKVVVSFADLTAATTYVCRVSEKCSAIFSTTSATGRYNVALSN